jgi:ubiquinone/menaquinone biosynthesis C-methylase UbiE
MHDPEFLDVKAAYDRWAPGYDDFDNPMVFAATRALDARLESQAPGFRAAEIGCGTGRNLAALKAAGAAALSGFDLSEGMLDRARARNTGAALAVHDMADPLPLPDASQDLVLVALAFEHVSGLSAPLAEIRRVLSPGGRALVLEIHPFMAMSGVGAHFKDAAGAVTMPTVAHTVSGYLNAFAGAGLRVTGCREWLGGALARDAPEALARKLVKRGADFPVLIDFELRPA